MKASELNTPKASIGVISYNHENFILDCLDSIRNQTYSNLEVHILDAGSSDDSQKIIKEYSEKYPGFFCSLEFSLQQIPVVESCNKILTKLDGDFVGLFAADDLMLKDRVSRQIDCFMENPKASLCYHNVEWFHSETGKKICNHNGFLRPAKTDYREIAKDNCVAAPSAMYAKWAIPSGGFNKNLNESSDFFFILEVASKGLVEYIPDCLVRYRRHDTNISKITYFTEDRLKFIEELNRKYPELKEATQVQRAVYQYYKSLDLLDSKDFIGSFRTLVSSLGLHICNFKWIARLVIWVIKLFRQILRL